MEKAVVLFGVARDAFVIEMMVATVVFLLGFSLLAGVWLILAKHIRSPEYIVRTLSGPIPEELVGIENEKANALLDTPELMNEVEIDNLLNSLNGG